MRKALPLYFLVITIYSCNRDPLNPPDPAPAVQWLKEITIQDSIVEHTHKVNFYYDASNRVSKMTFDSKTFYPAPQRYFQFFTDSFYYIGADTVPWKIASTVTVPGEREKYFTSFLTYDAQGYKIKDSVIRNDGGSINFSTRVRTYDYGAGYLKDNGYQDSIAFENGNTKQCYRQMSGSPVYTIYYDSVDNNTNPYHVLNIAEAYYNRHLYSSDDWVQNARKDFQGHFNMQSKNNNNMVKWRTINYYLGGLIWPWFYSSQYTYNSNGYPLTQDLIIREGAATGPLYNRLKYTYTYY